MIDITTLTTDTVLIHKSGAKVTVTAIPESKKYFKFTPSIWYADFNWTTAWNDNNTNSPNVGDFEVME